MLDTKHAREFANGGDYYTGSEVRLWVHNMADEIDRQRAELDKLHIQCADTAHVWRAKCERLRDEELTAAYAEGRRDQRIDDAKALDAAANAMRLGL